MGRVKRSKEPEAVAFELTTVAGKVLRRGFTAASAPEEPAIPPWLSNIGKKWTAPSEPVTYTGDVAKGHEHEARQWLRGLAPLEGKSDGTRRK
jgi:hypothetical protein